MFFSFFKKDESYLKVAIGRYIFISHKFSARHVDYRLSYFFQIIPDNVTIARTLDIPCTEIGLLYKNESYQDDHGQRVLALCDFWLWGKFA